MKAEIATVPAQLQEVALGQLGCAAVDPVEDVDHQVHGLVLAGHLLDVEVDVLDAFDGIRFR